MPGFMAHGSIAAAKAAAAAYAAVAKDFDGSNDYGYLSSNLSGPPGLTEGTISVWLNFDVVSGTQYFFAGPRHVYCAFFSDGAFNFLTEDSGSNDLIRLDSATAYSADTWLHYLVAWNTSAPVGHMYINDVDDKAAGATEVSGTADAADDWSVGGFTNGALLVDGCMSELWYDDTYIDISVEANRRKFIDASGKPVSLGADGSTPTGAQPLIYMPDADPSDNKGSGGNFVLNGALTDCADSPSD